MALNLLVTVPRSPGPQGARGMRSTNVLAENAPCHGHWFQPTGARTAPVACEEARVVHALVLNATFEPLCVVSARRALILVLNDKATSVEDSGAVLRSANATVPLPA